MASNVKQARPFYKVANCEFEKVGNLVMNTKDEYVHCHRTSESKGYLNYLY